MRQEKQALIMKNILKKMEGLGEKVFRRSDPMGNPDRADADASTPKHFPDVKQFISSMPTGHFYSPVPSLDEIKQDEERIFDIPSELPAIDLNVDEQLKLLSIFAGYYKELPFRADKTPGLRYFFENTMYSYSDAICLYSMIRHLKPRNK